MLKPSTKQLDNMLDEIQAKGGVMTWSQILHIKNDAKTFQTQRSRNGDLANELLHTRKLVRASDRQIADWKMAFEAERQDLILRLKAATEKNQWKLVAELADDLQYHKCDGTLFTVNR